MTGEGSGRVRRIRPTEVRAVLRLLEADHEDVEALAADIVRTINQMRADQPVWVRAVRDGTGYLLFGPYSSAEQARGDIHAVGTRGTAFDDVRLYRLLPPGR